MLSFTKQWLRLAQGHVTKQTEIFLLLFLCECYTDTNPWKYMTFCVFTRTERQTKYIGNISHLHDNTCVKKTNVKIFPKIFLTITEACRNLWCLTRINTNYFHFISIFSPKLPKLIWKNWKHIIIITDLYFVCSKISYIRIHIYIYTIIIAVCFGKHVATRK